MCAKTKSHNLPADSEPSPRDGDTLPEKDSKFWLLLLSMATSFFIATLELSPISMVTFPVTTARKGFQSEWATAGYAFSATAFAPLSAGLAQVFGRKAAMLGSLSIFALGSALSSAAISVNFLIAGRVVQGLGSSGVTTLAQIIVSELVPLRECGVFTGIIGITWGLAVGMGPVVGSSLIQRGQWRWLFHLDIAVCGVVAYVVLAFLKDRTPKGTLREKLGQVDWIGNIILITSTMACVFGLTQGSIQLAWVSIQVLTPVILGIFGLACFVIYEAKVSHYPIIPFSTSSTRSRLSGYLQTFLMPIIFMSLVSYLPVYYKACKDTSSAAAGIDLFAPGYNIIPAGLVSSIITAMTHQYHYQLWMSWALIMIGTGLLSTLHADSPLSASVIYQYITCSGIGILVTTTFSPIFAAAGSSSNTMRIAYFTFLRNFATIWAVAVGRIILQNGLLHRLPKEFQVLLPNGTMVVDASIPLIPGLEEPLKKEVVAAFADSVRDIWQVLIGLGGVGLLASLAMEHISPHAILTKRLLHDQPGVAPGT